MHMQLALPQNPASMLNISTDGASAAQAGGNHCSQAVDELLAPRSRIDGPTTCSIRPCRPSLWHELVRLSPHAAAAASAAAEISHEAWCLRRSHSRCCCCCQINCRAEDCCNSARAAKHRHFQEVLRQAFLPHGVSVLCLVDFDDAVALTNLTGKSSTLPIPGLHSTSWSDCIHRQILLACLSSHIKAQGDIVSTAQRQGEGRFCQLCQL